MLRLKGDISKAKIEAEKKRAKEIFAAQPSESESEPEHVIEMKWEEHAKAEVEVERLIPHEKPGVFKYICL